MDIFPEIQTFIIFIYMYMYFILKKALTTFYQTQPATPFHVFSIHWCTQNFSLTETIK